MERTLRKHGAYTTRGAYHDTPDDRLDRWYWDTVTGPVCRLGPGFRTRREAQEAALEALRIGKVRGD